MSPGADGIIALYERHADAWDRSRRPEATLEKHWLERFIARLPAGGTVLDLGCGSGQPIARYLLERGFAVVGIDSSAALIAKCSARFPNAEWLVADMRTLMLQRTFDGLIAWGSFFHLAHDAQRAIFAVFREHAAPGAALLFTSGTEYGEAIGTLHGEPLYHASLSTAEYRTLLDSHGFEVLHHVAADPECGLQTVWLAVRGTPPFR